jgi:CubicO group peptidase (beta-lactamase class C family)
MNATTPPSRWKPFLWGALTGGSLAFVAGGLLGAGVMWVWSLAEREAAVNPLADLAIDSDKLSPDETRRVIDRLAGEYLTSKNNVGLVVGIVKAGTPQVFAYGRVARENDAAPDGDTVFEIASAGKTFTATVLAEMHLRQELNWDDPLAGFLPEDVTVPRVGDRQITLLDLATQTSGLPSLPPNFKEGNPLNPYADYTVPEMYAGLRAISLTAPPGTEYGYSNLGFGLLGLALERRAGTSYEELVVSRLCQPLGMQSTRMTLDEPLKKRLATPHDGGKAVVVWEDTTMPGAGSFLSTANDMLRYVQAQWQECGPDDTLCRALHETIRKRRPADIPQRSMGLGWHIDSENALDIIWHNGGAGGSRSYVAFLPEPQVGVVVLSNSSNPVDALGHQILYLLARH